MRHVLEPAEGVGIYQGSVFAPAFDVSAALLVVDAAGVAVIGAGKGAAFAVEFETEGITATFGEDFKFMGARMIAPDGLAEEADAFDGRGASAAMGAVEPAVGTPGETIRAGVSVLDAEAGEMDFGVAIGAVVAVAVGIEEKVGRIQDPHAAAAGDDAAGEVQVGEEVMGFLENAVAVGVFVDGDAVGALEVMRRGGRDFVEHGAEILIVFHDLEAGGERVLEILHDPEAAAFVEVHVQRLAHGGFAGSEGHLEAGEDLKIGERLLGRGAGNGLVAKRAAGFEALDEVFEGGVEGAGVSGVRTRGGSSEGKQGEGGDREGFGGQKVHDAKWFVGG